MDDYVKRTLTLWRSRGNMEAGDISSRFLSYVCNETGLLSGVDKLGMHLPQLEQCFTHWCAELEIPLPLWDDAWSCVCDSLLHKKSA